MKVPAGWKGNTEGCWLFYNTGRIIKISAGLDVKEGLKDVESFFMLAVVFLNTCRMGKKY